MRATAALIWALIAGTVWMLSFAPTSWAEWGTFPAAGAAFLLAAWLYPKERK